MNMALAFAIVLFLFIVICTVNGFGNEDCLRVVKREDVWVFDEEPPGPSASDWVFPNGKPKECK